MLTAEEVKKEMDANEEVELECINEAGFISLYKCNGENNKIILNQGVLAVERVCSSKEFVYLKGVISPSISNVISFEELKYFRIKRPTPTFDDLIDVVSQALKDRVEFGGVELHQGGLNFENFHDDAIYPQDQYGIEKTIGWIKALYTETFVISNLDSLLEIDVFKCPKFELENGVKGTIQASVNNKEFSVQFEDKSWGSVGFMVLKGAIVTQKRGVQW